MTHLPRLPRSQSVYSQYEIPFFIIVFTRLKKLSLYEWLVVGGSIGAILLISLRSAYCLIGRNEKEDEENEKDKKRNLQGEVQTDTNRLDDGGPTSNTTHDDAISTESQVTTQVQTSSKQSRSSIGTKPASFGRPTSKMTSPGSTLWGTSSIGGVSALSTYSKAGISTNLSKAGYSSMASTSNFGNCSNVNTSQVGSQSGWSGASTVSTLSRISNIASSQAPGSRIPSSFFSDIRFKAPSTANSTNGSNAPIITTSAIGSKAPTSTYSEIDSQVPSTVSSVFGCKAAPGIGSPGSSRRSQVSSSKRSQSNGSPRGSSIDQKNASNAKPPSSTPISKTN